MTSFRFHIYPKNDSKFIEGETVIFQETGIQAVVSVLNDNSFDISDNYKFRTGQESTFYDQGRIIRKEGKSAPAKKLKIYYKSASFDSTDNGDLTTVESYKTLIMILKSKLLTEMLILI